MESLLVLACTRELEVCRLEGKLIQLCDRRAPHNRPPELRFDGKVISCQKAGSIDYVNERFPSQRLVQGFVVGFLSRRVCFDNRGLYVIE